MNLSHVFRIVIVLLLVAPLTVNAATSFTYQGKLLQGGAPADGTYHLRFQLWSALAAGAQVGSTIDLPAVNVADGLFTVDLNFGTPATIFTGADRWLQVAVITNGGATVTTLAPRQPLAPAPYAFFALNTPPLSIANFPTGGSWALSSNLNVDSGTLHVDALNNRVGIGTASPQGALDVASGDGSYVRVDTANGDIKVNGGSDGNFGLFNDGPSTGSTQIIGQGIARLTVQNTGNVGIGTLSPENTLHVHRGSAGAMTGYGGAPLIVENDAHSYINILSPAANEQGILFGNPTGGAVNGGILYNSAGTLNGLQFRTNGNLVRMVINGSGWVGIGTTVPFATLHAKTFDFGSAVGVRGESIHTGPFSAGVVGSSGSGGHDFFAEGAGTDYGSSSSIRWKDNIEPIPDPIEKLARLRGVYYDWDQEHGGHHDVGMIAEEVGAVLPEIVNYEANGIDAIGMDYSKLTPLLVEAVNALRAEKDAQLKAQQELIESQMKQISDLQARIEALEAAILSSKSN